MRVAEEKLQKYIEQIHRAKLIVSDIDGVVVIDGHLSRGAECFFNNRKFIFLSNNSRSKIEDVGSFFRGQGLNVTDEQIFLAGTQAVMHLCEKKDLKDHLAVSANSKIIQFAKQNGLNVLDRQDWSNAHSVLLCSDPELKFKEFEDLINLAANGVPFICANPDLTYPGENRLYAETGCVLTALQKAVPEIRCEIVGKPQTLMLEKALGKFKVKPCDAVFIGDNLKTDGLCAKQAGVCFLHAGVGTEIHPERLFEHFATCC